MGGFYRLYIFNLIKEDPKLLKIFLPYIFIYEKYYEHFYAIIIKNKTRNILSIYLVDDETKNSLIKKYIVEATFMIKLSEFMNIEMRSLSGVCWNNIQKAHSKLLLLIYHWTDQYCSTSF